MVRSVASSRGSESPRDPERAHRACEKCTRTKKKCDKALPACSRCTRLTTTCCYDFVYTAPTTAVVDSGYLMGSKHGDAASSVPGSVSGTGVGPHGPGILDPAFSISVPMILSLLGPRAADWRSIAERYLETMNAWLTVVHPELFALRVDGLNLSISSPQLASATSEPRGPVIALLLVCMQLVTQYDESAGDGETTLSATSGVADMLNLPAYIAAKRILGLLRSLSAPSVELAQCTILLAQYEFGHGAILRAYVTIGDANTMALALGIGPGKYAEGEQGPHIPYEEEERRCIYWSLLVLDRLFHIDCQLLHLPLQVPAPADDDLLPTTNIVWNSQMHSTTKSIELHPANVSPSVPLGSFQRNCQCAMLWTRALSSAPDARANDLAELDIATRALVEAIFMQATRWGDFFECFASCTSLLLLLYCGQLRTVDAMTIHPTTSDVTALKAIAGLNFTIRVIADTIADLNDHLARQPALLAPCSPLTSYSAYHCVMVLSNFEHVIPDADARFHSIYSSLHFFAKRWGVAGQLVRRVEAFLAEMDDETVVPWCFMSG